jgi:hypothetical protein
MTYNRAMNDQSRLSPILAFLLVFAGDACRRVVNLDPQKGAWDPGTFVLDPGLGEVQVHARCAPFFEPVAFDFPGRSLGYLQYLSEGDCLNASTQPGDAVDTVLAIYGVVPGSPDAPPDVSDFLDLNALAFNDDARPGYRYSSIERFVAPTSGWHLLWVSTYREGFTGFAYLDINDRACDKPCIAGDTDTGIAAAADFPDAAGCDAPECDGEVP